ncbi:uncharacterized protein LOC144111880 [Amblyomma americanum]
MEDEDPLKEHCEWKEEYEDFKRKVIKRHNMIEQLEASSRQECAPLEKAIIKYEGTAKRLRMDGVQQEQQVKATSDKQRLAVQQSTKVKMELKEMKQQWEQVEGEVEFCKNAIPRFIELLREEQAQTATLHRSYEEEQQLPDDVLEVERKAQASYNSRKRFWLKQDKAENCSRALIYGRTWNQAASEAPRDQGGQRLKRRCARLPSKHSPAKILRLDQATGTETSEGSMTAPQGHKHPTAHGDGASDERSMLINMRAEMGDRRSLTPLPPSPPHGGEESKVDQFEVTLPDLPSISLWLPWSLQSVASPPEPETSSPEPVPESTPPPGPSQPTRLLEACVQVSREEQLEPATLEEPVVPLASFELPQDAAEGQEHGKEQMAFASISVPEPGLVLEVTSEPPQPKRLSEAHMQESLDEQQDLAMRDVKELVALSVSSKLPHETAGMLEHVNDTMALASVSAPDLRPVPELTPTSEPPQPTQPSGASVQEYLEEQLEPFTSSKLEQQNLAMEAARELMVTSGSFELPQETAMQLEHAEEAMAPVAISALNPGLLPEVSPLSEASESRHVLVASTQASLSEELKSAAVSKMELQAPVMEAVEELTMTSASSKLPQDIAGMLEHVAGPMALGAISVQETGLDVPARSEPPQTAWPPDLFMLSQVAESAARCELKQQNLGQEGPVTALPASPELAPASVLESVALAASSEPVQPTTTALLPQLAESGLSPHPEAVFESERRPWVKRRIRRPLSEHSPATISWPDQTTGTETPEGSMTATQGHKHPTAHGRPWRKRRIRHLPSEHSPATISRLDQATGTETPEGSMTVTQGHKHPTAHGDGASDERSMLLNMIAEMGDPRSLTPLPPSPPHGGEESKVDQFEVTLPELPSKSPWLAWSPLSVASPSEPETSPPEPVPESTPPPESSQPTRLLEACVQVSREEQLEPATLEEPVVPLASFELPQDAAEGQEHGKEQTAFAPISIPEPGLVLEVTSEPPQPMRLSEAHMQESLDEQQDFEMRDVKELVALSVSSKLPHETAGMLEPVNDTMALASVSAPDLRPVPELTPTSEPPQPTQPSWDSVQEYLEEQLEPFTSSKREQQNLAMEAARELMVTSGSFELPQETAMQLEHAEEAMAPVSISALKPGLLPEVSPLSEASEPRHVLVASTQASLSEELKSAAVSKMELQAPVMEAVEELTMTSASSKLPQDIAGMLEHVAEPMALGAISVQETGLDVLVRSEPPQTAWPPDLFMLSQVAESAARCELKQENLGQEAPVTALPASPELAPAPVLESVALAASSEPVQPTTTALLPQLAESGLSPHPEAAFESEPHPAAAASPAEQRDLGAELPVVCPMTVRTSAAATLTASGTGQLREGTQPAEAAHLPSRARPSREESSSEEAEQSATTGQECPLQPQQMGSVLAALMAIVEKLGQISDNMQLFRNELGLWFRPDLHHPTELRDRRCASCGQEQSSGVAPLLVRGQEVPGQEQQSTKVKMELKEMKQQWEQVEGEVEFCKNASPRFIVLLREEQAQTATLHRSYEEEQQLPDDVLEVERKAQASYNSRKRFWLKQDKAENCSRALIYGRTWNQAASEAPRDQGGQRLKRRCARLPSKHSPAKILRLDQATGTETSEGSMTAPQGHKHPTAHGDGASDERSMLINMRAEMGDRRSLTSLPPSPPHGGEESKVDQFEVTLPDLPSISLWLPWSLQSVASPPEPETSSPEPVPESTPPPGPSQPTRLLEACVQVSREEQLEPATLEEPVVPLASFELPQDAAEGQEHGKEQMAFASISVPEPGLVLEVTSEPPQPKRLSEAHMQESLDEQQDLAMRDVKELVALSVSSKLPHETAGMLEHVNDTMALASVSAPDLRPVPELTPTSEPPQPTQPSGASVQEYLEEQLEPFTSSKLEQQNLAMEAARELMVTSGSFELPQETAMQLEHAEEAMAPVAISALNPGLLPEVSPLSEASESRHVLVASTQASLSEELKSAAVSKMELQAPVMEAVEELTMTSASSKLPQDIAGMLEHVAGPMALGAISVQETGLDVPARSEPPQTAWPPDLFMLSQVAESAARCELKQQNLGQEGPVTALPASPELAPASVLESVALAASSEPVQPTTTALLPQLAESGLSPHPEAVFESERRPWVKRRIRRPLSEHSPATISWPDQTTGTETPEGSMTATQGHKHPTAHGRPWLKRRIRHLPSEHSPATISRLDQATGTETPEGSMTATQGHKHPTAHGDGASDERSMLVNMIAEMGDPRSLTPLPPSPPHGGEESKVDQFEVTLPKLPSKSPWLAWSPLSVASPPEPETSPPEPVPESTPPPEPSQPTRLLEACVRVSREEQLEPATLEEPVVPLASFELPQDAAEGQEHGKEQTAFAPISTPEPGLVLEVTSEPPQPMRLSEAHMQESLDEQQDLAMRDVKELVALSVSSKLPHETAGTLEPVNDTMALASVAAPDLRPVPEATPTSEPPQPAQPSWDSVQEYLEEQLEPFTSSKLEQRNLAMEAARELMVTSGSFELPQETAMQLEHAEEAMAPVAISALKPGLLPEVSPLSEASESRHVLVASMQASLSQELKSAAVSKMELQAPVMEAVEELTMTSASSKLPQDIAGMLEHVAGPMALGAISVQETGLDVPARSEPPQTAWPPDLFMLSQVAESAARCELKQQNLGQEGPVTALLASPELAPAPVHESVTLAASSEPVQPTTTALLPQLAEFGLSPHPEAVFESEPHPAAAASPAEQRDLGAELPVVCPMTVRTSAAATLTASGTGQLREGTQPAEAAHLPSRARPSREESSSEEAEQSATTGQECPLQPQQMGSVLAALMAIVEKLGQISDNMQLFRNELGLWFRPELHHPTELRDRRCASCGQEQSSGVAPLLVRGQEVPGQEQVGEVRNTPSSFAF